MKMAQRVHVVLEDDIDGSEAVETVSFALDGVSYEIDLSKAHSQDLREALSSWISAARRVGGRRSTKQAKPNDDNSAIRAWALAQGMSVSARGRISQEIRDAYQAAH